MLAFAFGGIKMAITTAVRSNCRLRHIELLAFAAESAGQALERSVDTDKRVVLETSAHGGNLVVVGNSTVGVTLEDQLVLAPNVAKWERQAILGFRRRAFSMDAVRVPNDVEAARAELRWGALVGVDTGIYLNLGTSIAATLTTVREVLEGAHGAAGEIVHNLRHLHEDEGKPARRAPLEGFVGGGAIAARIEHRFEGEVTPANVFAAIGSCSEVRSFVEEILAKIAFHLSNLTIALDPNRIVLAGGLMRSEDMVVTCSRNHVQRFAPFPSEVVAGRLPLDDGLLGATAVSLEATGGPS